MPSLRSALYYAIHIQELRSMLQWRLWHDPVHIRQPEKETPSLRRCFELLDLTSRSFSAVIQELNHELLAPICLFYLILRGLDTIEDDMTLSLEKKTPYLRGFHDIIYKDGWNFTESGPNEKDRELLVNFQCVIEEFKKIKPEYQVVIKDITDKMGNGMADYAHNAEHNTNGVNSIKEYELYCHYVAGLVGEGLTRLFVEGGTANPQLLQRSDLFESMGQFLQQTNIIRDIREDKDDRRRFWPKEVWSKYVDDFDQLFVPENRDIALRCSSEMVLLALNRAPDCLFYLAGMKEQSVFNFAAIPQAMAIATLETCFRNPAIFERNVKITKGQACGLMIRSTQNLETLFEVFKEYARRIHKKNDPRDPNFLKISIACGKIEQFVESIFPSQGPKAIVGEKSGEMSNGSLTAEAAAKKKADEEEAKSDMFYMALAVLATLLLIAAMMMLLAWFLGARFDLVFQDISSRLGLGSSNMENVDRLLPQDGHAEL